MELINVRRIIHKYKQEWKHTFQSELHSVAGREEGLMSLWLSSRNNV
jgi:hypothetical protein